VNEFLGDKGKVYFLLLVLFAFIGGCIGLGYGLTNNELASVVAGRLALGLGLGAGAAFCIAAFNELQ
jgi:hypothetical protein